MAAAILGALAPIAAQILPSLFSSFGGKGGEGGRNLGDMTKSVLVPFGSKLIGRGIDWLTSKIFGTTSAQEAQKEEIDAAKAALRARRDMEIEEAKHQAALEDYRPVKKKKRRPTSEFEEKPTKKVKKSQPMELEGHELNDMFNEEQIPSTKPNYGAGGKYVYEKD